MRSAPPVSVRGSGGWLWRMLQPLLPAGSAAVATFWGLSQLVAAPIFDHIGAGTAFYAALASAALLFVLVLYALRRLAFAAPVQLHWDGQTWTADAVAGTLEVMIDLGSFLLLRLRPAAGGAARWVAVDAAEAGAAWHGLRVAAYARVPAPRLDLAPGATAG